MLVEVGAQRVLIHSDSQLFTQQVSETYEKKNKKMAKYAKIMQGLKENFVKFHVWKIPRNENGKADYL